MRYLGPQATSQTGLGLAFGLFVFEEGFNPLNPCRFIYWVLRGLEPSLAHAQTLVPKRGGATDRWDLIVEVMKPPRSPCVSLPERHRGVGGFLQCGARLTRSSLLSTCLGTSSDTSVTPHQAWAYLSAHCKKKGNHRPSHF